MLTFLRRWCCSPCNRWCCVAVDNSIDSCAAQTETLVHLLHKRVTPKKRRQGGPLQRTTTLSCMTHRLGVVFTDGASMPCVLPRSTLQRWKTTREDGGPPPSPPPHPHTTTRGDPEPLGPRLVGAQGGSGSSPPNWIPNRGVQVQPVLMILRLTYLRLGRRAACRDRRHQRRREGANLDQSCHQRN